jgi:hypothetical protein
MDVLGEVMNRIFERGELCIMQELVIEAEKGSKVQQIATLLTTLADEVQRHDGLDDNRSVVWVRAICERVVTYSLTAQEGMSLLRKCVNGNLELWLEQQTSTSVSYYPSFPSQLAFLLSSFMDQYLTSAKAQAWRNELFYKRLSEAGAKTSKGLQTHHADCVRLIRNMKVCKDTRFDKGEVKKWYVNTLPERLVSAIYAGIDAPSCDSMTDVHALASRYVNMRESASLPWGPPVGPTPILVSARPYVNRDDEHAAYDATNAGWRQESRDVDESGHPTATISNRRLVATRAETSVEAAYTHTHNDTEVVTRPEPITRTTATFSASSSPSSRSLSQSSSSSVPAQDRPESLSFSQSSSQQFTSTGATEESNE